MAKAANADIPQIAVISGPCTGANAVISQMMDITVTAAKTGEMRMASSAVLEDKTLGTPEKLAEQGVSAITAADDADALAKVRTLISCFGGEFVTSDNANRAVNIDSLMQGEYDVHAVINEVFDAGSFIELYAESAGMIVCGLAAMNGKVVGVMANNPAVKGGKLCPGSADKALKFLGICDRYAVPVITLADSCGIPSSDRAEEKGLAYKLALFAKAYATARVPKISVILGRAYGSLYSIFGSKAIGADIAFALDSAKIAAMAPEAAVEFLGIVMMSRSTMKQPKMGRRICFSHPCGKERSYRRYHSFERASGENCRRSRNAYGIRRDYHVSFRYTCGCAGNSRSNCGNHAVYR